MITGVNIKPSTQFAASSISSLTVSVGDGTSTYNQYASAFEVLSSAPSDTYFQSSLQFKATTMAASNIVAYFTAVGANLSALTGGSVDIDVCTVALP